MRDRATADVQHGKERCGLINTVRAVCMMLVVRCSVECGRTE